MKKVYILAAAALMAAIAWPASAQQIRFGVEAGGTISHSSWKFDDGRKVKGVGGYTAGVILEIEIFEKTWLQSGFSFLTKGARREIKNVDIPGYIGIQRDEIDTFRPMYVQLPISLAYKFDLTPNTRFFLSGGIFLSQGISGQYEQRWTYNETGSNLGWENTSENRNVFSSKALKRFDYGLRAGAGFELGRLVLRVGYDWSMPDIVKDKKVLNADEFKNRSIAIAVGLKF